MAMFDGLAPPLAFAGLAWSQAGQRDHVIQTAPGITADANTLFRVASISKVISGMMVDGGLRDRDISLFLSHTGRALRHPGYPDVPITGGMLASHSAGLHDDVGYAVPPDVPLLDWIDHPFWVH